MGSRRERREAIERGLGRERLARARARAAGAPDRFEAEGLAFHEALRQSFRDIAAAEPQRCVLVDGAAPPERVAQEIWRAIEARLPVAGGKADA